MISILVFYLSAEVGAGTSVWTVEGDKEKALGEDGEDLSDNEDGDDSTKESVSSFIIEPISEPHGSGLPDGKI